MIRTFVINFIIALVLLIGGSYPAQCAVERNDLIPLGQQLGFPVYEWRDNTKPTKAIIIGFHGMTFYGLAFDDAAKHFASEGYPFYSYDFQGFGYWRKGDKEYQNPDGKAHFTRALEDGKKLIKAIHNEYPEAKIYCIGESLGSNLALLAVSQEALPVDGEILCGLGIKNSIHPTPRWILDFVVEIINPNRPFNLSPYIKTTLASDRNLTKIYLKDPEILHKLSSVELVKAMRTNKESIKNIEQIPPSVSFLIISGKKDRMFKTSCLPEITKRLGPDRAVLKLLPKKGHLLLELGAMDSEVSEIIDPWLDNQIEIKETKIKEKQFKDKGALNSSGNAVSLLQ